MFTEVSPTVRAIVGGMPNMTDDEKKASRLADLIAEVPELMSELYIGPRDGGFLVRLERGFKPKVIHYLRQRGLQIEEDPAKIGVAGSLDDRAFFVYDTGIL